MKRFVFDCAIQVNKCHTFFGVIDLVCTVLAVNRRDSYVSCFSIGKKDSIRDALPWSSNIKIAVVLPFFVGF